MDDKRALSLLRLVKEQATERQLDAAGISIHEVAGLLSKLEKAGLLRFTDMSVELTAAGAATVAGMPARRQLLIRPLDEQRIPQIGLYDIFLKAESKS